MTRQTFERVFTFLLIVLAVLFTGLMWSGISLKDALAAIGL